MCSQPFAVAVMITQRVLNLAYGFDPLLSRLPLPEQDESLPAHATMRFSIPVRALA
jgi:hypothetical protein